MSEGVAFLHALAQALSTMGLYAPGHPAARRAIENLWQAVEALLQADPHPVFLFLGTAPVYNGRPLQELRDWNHSNRLAASGVQRIEFGADVTVDAIATLVDRLMSRLAGERVAADETPLSGVAYGSVAVDAGDEPDTVVADSDPAAELHEVQLDLGDEVDAMRLVLAEAANGRVARLEVDALARVLSSLVDQLHLPQVARSGVADNAPAERAINIALLVIASSALDAASRHRLGVAALLHDLSKEGVGTTDGTLADRPLRATALILNAGGYGLELAALTAYQHRWRPDGTGYPNLTREPHWASALIAAAAAFVDRRSADDRDVSVEAVLAYLADGVGTAFDAIAVAAVSSAVRPT